MTGSALVVVYFFSGGRGEEVVVMGIGLMTSLVLGTHIVEHAYILVL